MTKEEFINKLKSKIGMLDKSEIDDIVSEYEGFIDEKVASGMSEKEAVKSLGNVDEIAKDLKSAYKLDNDESAAKNIVEIAIEKMMNAIDVVIKSFENKNASDVIKMIIKVFLLVIVIRICKFPVDVLLEIAEDTFDLLGLLGRVLFPMFRFVVNVIYFVLAVMIFYRVFTEKIIEIDKVETKKEEKKVSKENKKDEKKENKKVNEEKKDEKVVVNQPKRKGFFDVCADIVLIFVKFIVFWFAFADVFYIVGISTALSISIYLIIKGVTYFGLTILLLALLLAGIAFLSLFVRFIINAKQKATGFLITLLLSLVIGGAGIGIFSLEIANTDIINKIPEDKIETVVEKYNMEDNLVISDYLFTDYVVDNKLKDTIKIEYSYYDDYFKFKPETYTTDTNEYKVYHMDYNATWTSKSFKNLIRDLKKKEIYNISDAVKVRVITSSDNIKKLKENYKEYEKQYEDLEEIDE